MTQQNTLFGRYLISHFIGSGATSEVYLARDTKLDRQVALKILKPTLVSDQTSFERFTREAQAASKLFHDHIATVLDMGEIDGRYYIAMKYVEGISLEKYLKTNGKMSWALVLRMVNQIGSAISFAHKQGYLHRDIKPNNIMITRQGNFVLTDFGLTRAMQDAGLTSTFGAVMGTPPYIPPEVWNGKQASPLSDQYALACVVNECLTGKVLFAGDTAQEIIAKHLVNRPDMGVYPPEAHQNIKFIVQKALSKQPKDRFGDIDSFVQALAVPQEFNVQAYLSSLEEVDRSMADKLALEKLKKRKKRKVWAITIAVLLAVGLVACGILYLFNRARVNSALDALRGREPAATESVEIPTQPEQPAEEQPAVVLPSETLVEDFTTDVLTEVATQTFTPLPTQTPTSTPTVTPTTASGEQVPVGSGVEIIMQDSETTGLDVYFYLADGSPVKDKYTEVYSQVQDLSGNWVQGDRLSYDRTDNAGSAGTFKLEPGNYIVTADLIGYNWGNASGFEGQVNVPVEQGKRTQVVVRYSRITIGFAYGDGSPVVDKYIEVFTQRLNIANAWVTGDSRWHGRTGNTGTISFNLTAGNYIFTADFAGYNWGDGVDVEGVVNIPARPGEETTIVIHLSRLRVILKDNDGKPITNGYVEVYYQDVDVNGQPSLGKRITYARTDNTGSVAFNLTPGVYAFEYDDKVYYNITLQPGRITETDGMNTVIID